MYKYKTRVKLMEGKIASQYMVKSFTPHNTCFEGYASVFGVIDHHNDMIVKGAFRSSLDRKIRLLWQHDSRKPIGVVIKLYEDDFGLKIEAEINNKIVAGQEASELIKQKAIDGLSIGFSIKSSEYNKEGQRLITEVDLLEVSIVTFPANQESYITQVKNREIEKIEGYSKALAELENLSWKLVKRRPATIVVSSIK